MTAKALHRTVLAVALAALGGSASAQPTTNPPAPPPAPCDPAVTADCPTASGGVSAGAGVDVNGSGVSGGVGVGAQVNGTVDANGNPIPPSTTTTVITPPPPPAETNVYVAPAPTTYEPVYVEPRRSMYDRYGIAVSLGGGVEGFTGDTLRNTTDPGGGWNVRLIAGLKSPLALEASYIGSAQNIDALGLSGNALLVGNGAQAAARLNLTGGMRVQPFVFGGAAWKHYQIMNESSNTSDLVNNDNVVEFPLGVGFGGRYRGLLLDLRGEYRIATQADLVSRTSPDARMDRFGVNASIGASF